MSRARTDQACLDAQLRAQVEQKLNAELAGERRDTERCPPPSMLERGLEAESFRALQECMTETESLTRAAAREFYEQVITDADRVIRETLQGMQAPRALTQLPWLETAQTGGDFFAVDKTPTAPDCAPAIAPEAVASTPARPVCACGQTIWAGSLDGPSPSMCADCEQEAARTGGTWPSPLDDRVKAASTETKSDDATECAWSTPTSEGEGWTFSSSNKETRK